MTDATAGISALASENRTFPPSDATKRDALVTGTWMYDEAAEDYQGFWAKQAAELLDWDTEWDTICEWDLPFAKWFVGGKLNVSHNCLDRHVAAGRGDKVAIHFEGEPGDTRTITYAELLDEVAALRQRAQGPRRRRGDRVNIYLPMIPEAAVAMLACARIGAAAQRRVRRVLVAGARRPHQRRRGQGADHRRRRLAARRGVPAQAGRRRGPRRHAHHRARRRRPARRQRRRDGRGPRPLVPRADGGRRRRVPGRADGRRAAAVPALHVGHHRQAEGHHAHDRRLPDPGRVHPQVRVRPPPRHRRLLVHRRRRLGHRAQLHRLRPARQRRHARDVRGRARTSPATTASGRSSRSTR